jgi:hypothetical protein
VNKIRYIEYNLIIGDAPDGLIIPEIQGLVRPLEEEEGSIAYPEELTVAKKDTIWHEGVVHDVIKWRNSKAWKTHSSGELLMDKASFIGADAGVFFILIDESIDESFTKLADMMDVFIEKTKSEAPFVVYGLIENKQKIAELKTNKDMLKNLADVKKWAGQHRGEFRLENLKEMKMNLMHVINDYCHYALSHLETKTNYKSLRLGEVHFLDYEDLSSLKDIEAALEEQTAAGQTVDNLLSNLFFEVLKKDEFQEEVYVPPPEPEIVEVEETPVKPPPSKIKQIIEEIRLGIRRQCPKCFNLDRNLIREVVDKTHVIMQNPNIYGFKFICGQCGHEWKKVGGKAFVDIK